MKISCEDRHLRHSRQIFVHEYYVELEGTNAEKIINVRELWKMVDKIWQDLSYAIHAKT